MKALPCKLTKRRLQKAKVEQRTEGEEKGAAAADPQDQ
jgi:hypothetical protein